MNGKVGQMIYDLREEAGMTQQSLCRNILSVADLSRLESGEKEADKFTLEALFQRLGKSLDKLELTISDEEYEVILMRADIFESLEKREFQKTEQLLKEYEACVGTEKVLQWQFLLQMQALYCYLSSGNIAESAALAERALDITFPERKQKDWASFRLCTQTIQIILFRSFLLMEAKDWNTSARVLGKLAAYLEQYYTDAEEKAKVYPQCMWLLAESYIALRECENAREACAKGKECLAKNGALAGMMELLKAESMCLEHLNRLEELELVKRQMEAIHFLYEIAAKEMPKERALVLYMTSSQDEFTISNELIVEQRIAKDMSQEDLSEDICARETLSRIESGKRSPNRKNLRKMFQKLDLDRERYYGFVASDDYSVYEKVREYNMACFGREKEKAQRLMAEIEAKLDLSLQINRQYVGATQLNRKIAEREIDREQALTELQKVLCYTMKEFRGKVYRIPSREECIILNQMALSMKHLGRMNDAIDLYEQILKRYENSRVLKKHHAVSEMLLYMNYLGVLEVSGYLKEAEQIGKEGISLALACRRGDSIAHMLANLACVYEKTQSLQGETLCESCLRNSYYLLNLYLLEKDSLLIRQYYDKKYEILLD